LQDFSAAIVMLEFSWDILPYSSGLFLIIRKNSMAMSLPLGASGASSTTLETLSAIPLEIVDVVTGIDGSQSSDS